MTISTSHQITFLLDRRSLEYDFGVGSGLFVVVSLLENYSNFF